MSPSLQVSDGVTIAYENWGKKGPIVVLIHGWSGSRHYFDLNAGPLSKHCRVYALDLRCHGESGRPAWGHHVARLAKDIYDMLEFLDLWDVTLVGTSLGASIIWSYFELFGHAHLARAAFVDQPPLQNRAEDWALGSNGCYDAASLARLQMTLKLDFESVADGNLTGCLSRPIRSDVLAALKAETMRADPLSLGKIMADHTQSDWRPTLPRIDIPCLNVIGGKSGLCPIEGCKYVTQHVPDCEEVVFEDCNHWLYLEDPQRFNLLITDFVMRPRVPEATAMQAPIQSLETFHA
ncbi:hypothetical protein WJX74_008906 [Apatococcus lobatus]|uniref:AB hydrolase-1 domain-containing protein n=1 Tax=Apatococcus lobatus TaxID=904363 RepID=A0AAW1QU12_9CHLO